MKGMTLGCELGSWVSQTTFIQDSFPVAMGVQIKDLKKKEREHKRQIQEPRGAPTVSQEAQK